MAIAFCVAYEAGVIAEKTEPIPIKSHGYRAQSAFRYGLDKLQNLIANISKKYKLFKWLPKQTLPQILPKLT